MHDLTDRRHGSYVALRQTNLRHSTGIVWECQCDCGRTVNIDSQWLRLGDMKDCICDDIVSFARQYKAIELKYNLVGQQFGMLSVKKFSHKDSQGSKFWHCDCECGKTAFFSTYKLVRRNITNCGCVQESATSQSVVEFSNSSDRPTKRLKRKYTRRKPNARLFPNMDIIGKIFGNWKVLDFIGHTTAGSWKCECECGNTRILKYSQLTKGTIKFCDYCSEVPYEVVIKKEFGRLTPMYAVTLPIKRSTTVVCECTCGNTKQVEVIDLLIGKIKSCGCLGQECQELIRKKPSVKKST